MIGFLNTIFSIIVSLIASVASYPVADGVTIFSFIAGGLVIVLLIKFFWRS